VEEVQYTDSPNPESCTEELLVWNHMDVVYASYSTLDTPGLSVPALGKISKISIAI
jgi:hypothetical protein